MLHPLAKKRDNNRFEGIGEFQFAGHFALEHCRRLFFDALAQVEPELLRSLIAGPYQVALGSGIDLSTKTPSSRDQLTTALTEVRKAARAWCTRWRLVDSWCLDFAYDTVLFWVRQPEHKDRWAEETSEWVHQHSFPRFHELKFDFGGWSMVLQTWNDFEASARASFEKCLTEYRKEAELAATLGGLVRTKTKRRTEHFLWLARRVLKQQRPSEMARFSANVTADSVRKATTRLAKEIGLTLPAAVRS